MIPLSRLGLFSIVFLSGLTSVLGQPSPEELAPLYEGLSMGPLGQATHLQPRVPLSTDDNTAVPLISQQVYAPPVVPTDGSKCQMMLLEHEFGDGSYGTPAIVNYVPPVDPQCGAIGNWSALTLNLTVTSSGTQYDRLSSLYLSHVEIWRHSSAEPTKTGTIWVVKDVTQYRSLFAKSGPLLMEFDNVISNDLGLNGPFHVTLTATFFTSSNHYPQPKTPDLILPLSNLSPNSANYFSIQDDVGGIVNVTVPTTTQQAYVEIYASGNSAEEFWYLNTPDEILDHFPPDAGLIGKGPFREVQVLIDGRLAGVVWPYPVIFTGGITPTNWRPLTAYGAYDQPTYYIDVTPFLPSLADGKQHIVTLRVQGQGTSPSINSNWFVSGSLHLFLGKSNISGRITQYNAPTNALISVDGGILSDNETVWATVIANRSIVIESELRGDGGDSVVRFEQKLGYTNFQRYVDVGWVQWGTQVTEGTVRSTHNGKIMLRDAFSYPLSIFSNYSLYEMQFGSYESAINQTHARVLQLPTVPGRTNAILSIQHASGEVGMDDAPGLRHAINGTGATDQKFAFTSSTGQTYFRDVAAKNDGWVRDEVWGTLRGYEPPVPKEQLFPGSGPGFRHMLGKRVSA